MTPLSPAARNLPEFLKSVATSTADAVSHLDDDDRRVYFLAMLDTLDWKADDARWRSGLSMLSYDREWPMGGEDDVLRREILGLLVRITFDAQDMILMRVEHADRVDVQEEARQLRADADRLHAIVYAMTAVHCLGSVDA